jgi:hypothetical protein
MNTTVSRLSSPRGAVLIQVAIALLGLVAFTAFVVDYGVMWASRGQAQTAADAGALSGAMALTFDSGTDIAGAKEKARALALANPVFGQPPDVTLNDIHVEPCPPTPPLGPGTCVRAETFRNQRPGGSPLPIFFGSVVGIPSQGVRATATARAIAANAANCIKPWAVADKWLESTGTWTQQSTFDPPADVYDPPTDSSYGTGFSNKDANGVPIDYGYQLVLKLAHPGNAVLSSGWAMAIDLPNGNGNDYATNITACTSATVHVALPGEQCLTADPSKGCFDVYTGAHAGDTQNRAGKPLGDLIATDSTAYWSNGGIVSTQSPSKRVVPIAVFDPELYMSRGYNGTNGVIKVVNILGFFLEGNCSDAFYKEPYLQCSNNNQDVVGRLVNYPGTFAPGAGTVAGAFGQVLVLVR